MLFTFKPDQSKIIPLSREFSWNDPVTCSVLLAIKNEQNLKSVMQKLQTVLSAKVIHSLSVNLSIKQTSFRTKQLGRAQRATRKSEPFESNSPMRQETWSHKRGKQLKQKSHLGLRCIELSELRRDLQIFLPPWLMTGDWGAVPQAHTSVIKAATSAKCNWADCLGSSKH